MNEIERRLEALGVALPEPAELPGPAPAIKSMFPVRFHSPRTGSSPAGSARTWTWRPVSARRGSARST